MATEWETEDEFALAAQASLPAPMDAPSRTPSRNSRRSVTRKKSSSPGPSSSPPPLPSGEMNKRNSLDVTNDESISILDPRRFTPTLHANLVSEILSLRRDQEERSKIIGNLENELHETRGEHEALTAELLSTAKESRKQQRQLALLEGGTLAALSELSRERDEAIENAGELRKRLESSQRKIRSEEENANRAQELWSRDKEAWDEEKRKYERKIHVAESRLKTIMDEVAAFEINQQSAQHPTENETDFTKENSHNDGISVRTMSMTNSLRFSMLSGPHGYMAPKVNGVSLADELDFDAESEDQTDIEGRESVMSNRHMRNQSRESIMSKKHRRNQSLESLMRPGSVARGRLLANQSVLERLEAGIMEDDETVQLAKVQYVDAGIQYSPPPSPKIDASEHFVTDIELNTSTPTGSFQKPSKPDSQSREFEVEANQRRKRVHASPQFILDASSQSTEEPLSPPRTPVSPTRAPPPPPPPPSTNEESHVRKLVSSCTQTDAPLPSPTRSPPLPPIPIPSIQLHPPKSRPATPLNDRVTTLPQYYKNAAIQVVMEGPMPTRSIAVQTEEIRVDMRMNHLPPHLHPSAISSRPPSPEPEQKFNDDERFTPVPAALPPRNPLRRARSQQSIVEEITSSPPQTTFQTCDAYPGNNDDGPLASNKPSLRRPHRISSLFAGFENISSDEADDFADADMSDNDYRTALSAPRHQNYATKSRQRISSFPPASTPQNLESHDHPGQTSTKSNMRKIAQHDSTAEHIASEVRPIPQRASMKSIRQLDKPLLLVTNPRPPSMARRALIQSGVAAHQGLLSPSLIEDQVIEPPFPIPTRASSRNPPFSVNAQSDHNRSPTPRTAELWSRGGRGNHCRSGSVRKARPSNISRGAGARNRRRGSRSPPPLSISTEGPESPRLPPLPRNDVSSPRWNPDRSNGRYRSHRQQPSSSNTANTINTINTNTTNTASASLPSTGPTSVVNAIAQTMIGEWMFKYVRRRKSFGMSEPTGGEENASGIRHKRWVWLAPYERAVMWSSKQPTSGSALLGKTGRKLTIQSVLDVKDDNPSPKGIQPLFNRSILILTPARALKFTAVSSERHYVWLTALSFLAHSSQAVPEIAPIQPMPQMPTFEVQEPKHARLRKHGIRDSIRVAKGKAAPAYAGPMSIHSSQQDRSIREAASFYTESNAPRISESAEPPAVPRFLERNQDRPVHSRKRSNTGGTRVAPPLSFRGFSAPGSAIISHAPSSSTAGQSIGTTGSSDIYPSQPGSSFAPSGYGGSTRTSDASARPGAVVNNFFEAVGTVRMEAFITPMAMSHFEDFPDENDEMDFMGVKRYRSGEGKRRNRRDSYYSSKARTSEDWYSGSKTAGEEEYHREGLGLGIRDDPFRGF